VPHIELPDLPGIVAPARRYPDTGRPLFALAEAILRGPSPLTPAERELIATHVSERNRCAFCSGIHAAAARHLLGPDAPVVDGVRAAGLDGPVDARMRALLAIADRVVDGGRSVTSEHVSAARAAGADDRAIHDTVLVAAAFCMYNRYVDGLACVAPEEPDGYREMGARLAEHGYRLD
jgi:uncharacterized peroxidase-related enzyme